MTWEPSEQSLSGDVAEIQRLRAEVERLRLDTLREVRAYVEGPGALHDCCYGTDVDFMLWLDEQIVAAGGGPS